MLTSGLTTIWSQCVITALMGLFETGNINLAFTLDTWKGTSKMRPCFAAIRSGDLKMSDNDMYEQLKEILIRISYIHPDNPDYFMNSFRQFFTRLQFRAKEISIIRGICRQIDWYGKKCYQDGLQKKED